MRAAIVDVGACTLHAVVADVDDYGVRETLYDRTLYERTPAALDALLAKTQARRPAELRVVATAPSAFAEEVCARRGLRLERIAAEERALLAWLGVSTEMACSHGELAVVDLGGSTLALATGSDGVTFSASYNLGVLALRSATPAEISDQLRAETWSALATLRSAVPDTLAVTSGTARALLKLARRLGMVAKGQRYVSTHTFKMLARRLAPLDGDALAVLGVQASRRDTIAAGAVALATVLELLGRPVAYVAASAMREGALVALARREQSMARLLASG